MVSGRSDLIELSGILEHETERAILVDFGGDDPVWIPKSQCEYSEEKDGSVTVSMSERLAKEKEIM